jgi:hypothetical protein
MPPHAIDIGPQAPQISIRAWKSPNWRGFANSFPFAVGGLALFMGLVVLGNKADAEVAPVFFVIALFLFLTFIPLRAMGKSDYRLGFDRRQNALWVYRKDRGITGVEHDAHKITGFSFTDKSSFTINGQWHLNLSMPFLWHKTEWIITVGRVGSQFQFGVAGSGLATKGEAREVVVKANALLGKTGHRQAASGSP